jgi:hypothetical protein
VEEELVEEELDEEDEDDEDWLDELEVEEIELVLEMLEEARNGIKLAHGQVKSSKNQYQEYIHNELLDCDVEEAKVYVSIWHTDRTPVGE